MRSPLTPGLTEEVRADSALVIAPHYDDEVLGCGGLICRLTAAGAVVRVLFLSDSSGGVEEVPDRQAYSSLRGREARQAAEVLGVAGIDDLGLVDGSLEHQLEQMVAGIRRALVSQLPDLLLVTSPLEVTADHRAAFRAVHDLLGGFRSSATAKSSSLALPQQLEGLRVLAYEVNHPLYPDLLLDVSEQVPQIERAMACYASQQERHDYLAARLGLLRYRALSLPVGVEAVEAFRQLSIQDFMTRGPSRLIVEMGGAPQLLHVTDGPRMSVIVRTKDRPQLLAEALGSLAESTYRKAEVIVVNDGGAPPPRPEGFPLPMEWVDLENNLGRAAAANAGVARASGDVVCFLDDDDLVEPEHLATLAGLVSAAGIRVAYVDAAVGIYELDGEVGWRLRERRLPYSRDFDPELLLLDNYIPFHTLAIERSLFSEVGELDRELPFFEDWDYLIRLSQRTPFHHLARVTCEYRHFRQAGHHILGDDPRSRGDFLTMKARVIDKHAQHLQGVGLARVIDRLRGEEVAALEEAVRQRRQAAAASDRSHHLNGRLTSSEHHARALEQTVHRLRSEKREAERQLAERDRQLSHSFRDVEERERTLSEVKVVLAERDRLLEARDSELERLYARERELVQEVSSHSEHLGRTYGEIERLQRIIREMEATRSWRLHQWLERRRS